MAIQRFNPVAAAAISPADNGKYVLASDYDALLQENTRMREAIEFATAPDMWVEREDDLLEYRYREWYVNVLRKALETDSEAK